MARYARMSASSVATPEELKTRIEAGIPGARADVTGDGHHFNAIDHRAGVPRIVADPAHRLVYDVFGPRSAAASTRFRSRPSS